MDARLEEARRKVHDLPPELRRPLEAMDQVFADLRHAIGTLRYTLDDEVASAGLTVQDTLLTLEASAREAAGGQMGPRRDSRSSTMDHDRAGGARTYDCNDTEV
ncbi:MAG: hypothetical protein ACE5D3_08535 [Candidatus Binatia bacterium]